MDRIHRLGQHRPVKITRLIIENSIESRIVQLQEKKTALVESTVGMSSLLDASMHLLTFVIRPRYFRFGQIKCGGSSFPVRHVMLDKESLLLSALPNLVAISYLLFAYLKEANTHSCVWHFRRIN